MIRVRNNSTHERNHDQQAKPPPAEAPQGNLVPLPAAPRTGSPVPWLTSIHATEGRGEYGQASYPGNCSGLLIRDLLLYYRPKHVLDPMSGGGTCRDVCQELGIRCTSFDVKMGKDACERESYAGLEPVDFVWLHPPYWRMIRYSQDPRCLSNAPTLEAFLERLTAILGHCKGALTPGGYLAVLMGDGKWQGDYLGLPFRTYEAAVSQGLVQAAPEIVRFSHGTSSSSKEYTSSFIPRLHDLCLIFRPKP